MGVGDNFLCGVETVFCFLWHSHEPPLPAPKKKCAKPFSRSPKKSVQTGRTCRHTFWIYCYDIYNIGCLHSINTTTILYKDICQIFILTSNDNICPFSFNKIISVERLVELGYPKELNDTKYLPDFAVRGLIFDRKLGNFLKLDLHGLVLTACRGQCLYYSLRTIVKSAKIVFWQVMTQMK